MIEKILHTPKGLLTVRIPTVLNEVTLGQMMALQEQSHPGDVETISLLSGITEAELYELDDFASLAVFSDAIRSLAHQVRYLYHSNILPRKVSLMLGKRKVVLPVLRHLSIEPADALIAASDIIADEINRHILLFGEDHWRENFQPSLRSCCNLLAQYFFCRATGKKYDEFEVIQFAEDLKQMRITDVLPIARHFFSAYPDLIHQHFTWLQRIRLDLRRRQVIRRLRSKKFS
jgi:hypothetical protein